MWLSQRIGGQPAAPQQSCRGPSTSHIPLLLFPRLYAHRNGCPRKATISACSYSNWKVEGQWTRLSNWPAWLIPGYYCSIALAIAESGGVLQYCQTLSEHLNDDITVLRRSLSPGSWHAARHPGNRCARAMMSELTILVIKSVAFF